MGAVLALLASGCMRPAENRAVRDSKVGRADSGGMSLEVEDGLAAVRSLAAGELTLWGNAPAFTARATLSGDARSDWLVTVRNAMPDAELVAQVEGGEVLAVEALPQALPTVKAWRVGLPAGAKVRFTVAPPDWQAREPFRFVSLADVQEALPRVGDIYARMRQDDSVRFILFSGDLTETGSQEELLEFQSRLEAGSRIPLYATLGNHETFSNDAEAYSALVGRGSQSFVFRNVRFSVVDSSNGTLDPVVEEQLEGWLAASRDGAHVVSMHVPPQDPVGLRGGGFANRAESAGLVGKMAREGVDLTLYGHIHSYYSFTNAGIPAFISGGGGAIPETFDGVGRHYLVVDIGADDGLREVSLVRVD
ncbi:metallophosphoesterase [Pyxidicoccus fallax]|uniref:Metallophosphoesterase n=1 Tax=Pyxidicoccus fallax TaxID=394095 RepID=A0A848LSS3_9BACT|nr:metallophosphoesterase [Pyxidicoccus fallax]NMO21017.1 metallophosphoesterase [Pyxidicoccus fallax]NPC82837.1 metallophosphoesterase [Pyxidicoccus fallax]